MSRVGPTGWVKIVGIFALGQKDKKCAWNPHLKFFKTSVELFRSTKWATVIVYVILTHCWKYLNVIEAQKNNKWRASLRRIEKKRKNKKNR